LSELLYYIYKILLTEVHIAVRKIDFDRIDSVKLILAKTDFKLKWFMFEYIFMQKCVEQKF
jgi:hypothetical protein